MSRYREVVDRARGHWREILVQLGVPGESLDGSHGPCPGCGGEDRFMFDDVAGSGSWICHGGGSPTAGHGLKLVTHALGLEWPTNLRAVADLLGDAEPAPRPLIPEFEKANGNGRPAAPTPWCYRVLRSSTSVENVPAAKRYLQRRRLWPLPKDCQLSAHPMLEFFDRKRKKLVGSYPAIVARVTDAGRSLVTLHVTYLGEDGAKADVAAPRKILSPVRGRVAPAVRLMSPGRELAVGEGIETCLAASRQLQVPAWSCLNTSLLERFELGGLGVSKLVILVDLDRGGVEAASKLAVRMARECAEVEVMPSPKGNDWADAL